MNQKSIKPLYSINDTVFLYNSGAQDPLISSMVIKGIVNHEDGFYYTSDKSMWIKEEYLSSDVNQAYLKIIKQAQEEMKKNSEYQEKIFDQ